MPFQDFHLVTDWVRHEIEAGRPFETVEEVLRAYIHQNKGTGIESPADFAIALHGVKSQMAREDSADRYLKQQEKKQ